jgi:exopolysaccharide biosynthesis polyprenyl glycosylphosphotransferase
MIERVLILGMTPLAEHVMREIERRPGCRYSVVGVLDDATPPNPAARRVFAGPLSGLQSTVEKLRPTRIVVALTERRGKAPMRALLESYVSDGVVVEDVTEFYERFSGKLALEWLTPMRVIASGKFQPSRLRRAFARITSLAAAAVALVVLSPLLAVIAIAIKLDSRGPVLFTQNRVGLRGRPFTLLKFRSMQHGPRRSEWEGDNRDHVTRVGKWLRRFRVDELPQFVNVLRGEMNLIGPRPHPVTNLELFTLVARNLNEVAGAAIGCYALRLVVPPGITGWAQVRYRYANNLDEEIEKLRYDLHYVKHMSCWLDLRILFETVAVMLRGKGGAETDIEPGRIRAVAPARAWNVFPWFGLTLMIALPSSVFAQTPEVVAPESAPAKYEYVIGPADVLEIAVWQNTLISRTIPVRPDGKISIPVLNDVQAAGLTPMELQASLIKALAAYIQTPEVSVIVREVHSFNVSVLGHVKTPGRYEMTSRVTVLDALAMAGGLTEYADRGNIVILRRDGMVTKQLSFAYDKVTPGNGSKGQVNLLLQPEDIILVR